MAWPCRAELWGDAARARRAPSTPRSPTPSPRSSRSRWSAAPRPTPPRRARRCAARGRGRRARRSTTRGCATAGRSSSSAERRARRACTSASTRWGEKFPPYDARRGDRRARSCEHLGLAVDDARRSCSRAARSPSTAPGTLVTTEQCLLNPNRNPHDARRDRARRCATASASSASSGSPTGSLEDDDTDGHVDNVVAFVRAGPRRCCRAATTATNPNHAIAAATTVDVLDGRGPRRDRGRRCCPYATVAASTVAGPLREPLRRATAR